MRNAILLTLVGIVAVSLLTVGVVYALPQESPAEFSSGASAEALPSEDTSGYPYLLRSYDGKLAVFTDDLVEPDLVFDVYVRTLPEYDQQQLERGVRVKDYDKLTALIEDYKSGGKRGFLCESARPSLRRRLRAGGRRIFVGTEGSRSRPRIWRKKEAVERERALLRFCHFSREAVTEL